MSDHQPPRSPRPGGPRRPAGHRARAGGSARQVPRSPRQGATERPSGSTPTRALPLVEGAPQRTASPGSRSPYPSEESDTGIRNAPSPRAEAGHDPVDPPSPGGDRHPRRRTRFPRPLRLGATLLVLVLVIVVGWGAGLVLWSDSRIEHVDALSGAANTEGTTYLIAGSDRRGGDVVNDDGTEGARTDTIMLLHKARNGNSYLVSLPRDTLVDIPGHGGYKLNAAYAFGGAPLLVETVEDFTGLTIDHYVEIGFDGVSGMVDAVDHVNLCIDRDVDDSKSGLEMTKGCHDVGGEQALAFVRARYFDPTADIGRQQRQQQFVSALMDRVSSPSVLLNPFSQVKLAGSGSDSLVTSEGTGIVTVGRMALTARSAMSAGTVAMPIDDPAFQTRNSGVAILTDDADIAAFFGSVKDGSAEVTAAQGA